MNKIKEVFKIVYLCLLTLCVLFGTVLDILTYIPFSKGEWFEVLFNVCIIFTLILLIPLLIYFLIKLIKKYKERKKNNNRN